MTHPRRHQFPVENQNTPPRPQSSRPEKTSSPMEQLGEVSVILPDGFEPSYRYPLIVWLCSDRRERFEMLQRFPSISDRNYIGLVIEYPDEWLIDRLDDHFQAWLKSQIDLLPVHRQRIYLAGTGFLGEIASRMSGQLNLPIAGAISLLSDTINAASIEQKKRHFWIPSTKAQEQAHATPPVSSPLLWVIENGDLNVQSTLWRDIDRFIMQGIYSAIG